VPGRSRGDVVSFYIEARDGNGAVSTFPADGKDSRALIRWTNESDRPSDITENLAIILTDADAATLKKDVNQMTNHRQRGTVLYGDQVFYDVGVKLKGSQRGRPDLNRRGFSIRFHADQKFRGVHDSIGLDRSGGWRFGSTYGQDEILIWPFFNRAGGIPSLHNDIVNLRAPGVSEGSAQLQLACYSNNFLDDQFEDGADGSLHNYELIYYPTTTAGGVQGLKRPNPDNVLGVPLRDMGNNQEAYRYHFQLRNNRTADNYNGMIGLTQTFSLSGDAFFTQLPQTIDVNQWLRAYAGVTLAAVNDSYFNNSNAHNARFYHRPLDGRMLLFPWDMDFAFILGETSPLVVNTELRKILANPVYERAFYGHVLDIIDGAYNADYMDRWVDHYAGRLTRQSISAIKSFISRRSTHARNAVEKAIPKVGFSITSNDFTGDTAEAMIEGRGWVNVNALQVEGSDAPLKLTWLNEAQWQATVTLGPGENALTVKALNSAGEAIASDRITITNTSVSTGYALWKQTHNIADDLGDPDRDGVSNLFEYFSGQDPNASDDVSVLEVELEAAQAFATVLQAVDVDDFVHEVTISDDLVTWSADGVILDKSIELGNGLRSVRYRLVNGHYVRLGLNMR
jgi:hypothetical protein